MSAQRKRRERGFTLIELMVVVLVVGILLGIAVPTFLGARGRAQDAAATAARRTASVALSTLVREGSAPSVASLQSFEPSVTWTTSASTGPSVVSVAASSTGAVAAIASPGGRCFWTRVPVNGSGSDWRTSGGSCTATAAIATTLSMAGIVGYWPLDDTGTATVDVSANGRDGTYAGAVTTGTSAAAVGTGTAATFDGTTGHVVLPAIDVDWTQGITVAAWVRPTRPTGSGNGGQRIVDLGSGPGVNNIIVSQSANGPYVYAEAYVGAASPDTFGPLGSWAVNTWQHVVMVFTPAPASTMQLYRNGALVATLGSYPQPSNVNRTSNYLARSNWAFDQFLQGSLDEVAIWNRPLTSQEIAALANPSA